MKIPELTGTGIVVKGSGLYWRLALYSFVALSAGLQLTVLSTARSPGYYWTMFLYCTIIYMVGLFLWHIIVLYAVSKHRVRLRDADGNLPEDGRGTVLGFDQERNLIYKADFYATALVLLSVVKLIVGLLGIYYFVASLIAPFLK